MPSIKIMHIDPEYQVFLMAIEHGSCELRRVPLNEALDLMQSKEMDLIVSEPQHRAIFDKPVLAKPAAPKAAHYG